MLGIQSIFDFHKGYIWMGEDQTGNSCCRLCTNHSGSKQQFLGGGCSSLSRVLAFSVAFGTNNKQGCTRPPVNLLPGTTYLWALEKNSIEAFRKYFGKHPRDRDHRSRRIYKISSRLQQINDTADTDFFFIFLSKLLICTAQVVAAWAQVSVKCLDTTKNPKLWKGFAFKGYW